MKTSTRSASRGKGPRARHRAAARGTSAALLFVAALVTPAASAFTINPAGGRRAADGLRVEFAPNTQLQVWREGVGQIYNPTAVLPGGSSYDSVYVAVGRVVYGASCLGCTPDVTPWTPISETTVSGSGTPTDPWRGTTRVRAGDEGPTVTVVTSYAMPDEAIRFRVTVDVPEGTTERVKLYHVVDTYLGGRDAGPAYSQPRSGSPTTVGVIHGGTYAAFLNASPAWSDWFSGDYGVGHSRVMGGGDLQHTLDTGPVTDNGLGVQWDLVTPGRHEVTYSMVFSGRAPCADDLECGATGGHCDTSVGLCYACVTDAHCGGTTPSCNTMAHECGATGDIDGDGDGVPDQVEAMVGTNPAAPDSDLDTVSDREELGAVFTTRRDTDGDGVIDALDDDDDGDGIATRDESPGTLWGDNDGDDAPDYLDDDDDDDGIRTIDERPSGANRDTDGNGVPDHLEADDDHDGIITRVERTLDRSTGGDADGDGLPSYLDTDSDGDGVHDSVEQGISSPRDTDGDGAPDFIDHDDDGDGVDTRVEVGLDCSSPLDTDGDGLGDYIDTDSDNDCAPDSSSLESGPARLDPALPRRLADENCTAADAPVCNTQIGVCGAGFDGDGGMTDGGAADGATDSGATDSGATDSGATDGGRCSGATPTYDNVTGRCVGSPVDLGGGFTCSVSEGTLGGGRDVTGLALLGLALGAMLARRRR